MKHVYQLLCAIALMCMSLFASAQIPIYNSYPSSPAVIYLDFDGQTVEGTSWNVDGPIVCGASNLTTAQINEIYNRVAEDYRPFNINITTDSNRYWAAPPMQRIRVILTVTSAWYGAAGGTSFVGSFTWGDNTPAFVFTALLNYNTKNISEAAAHEAGHTLGLRHQASYDNNCVKTSDYNYGTGTGEISWAPIMGVGYSRNFTLWNNGANPLGCTDYQDDLGIISGPDNGFGYRNDDYSNYTSSATVANIVNNAFTMDGIIERNNDVDVFKFTMPSNKRFHLDALPFSVGSGDAGSDLDMQVELIDAQQNVIGTYNPPNTLNATIDTLLNPGVYYLRVRGMGNIYAPQYASLGSYKLNATFSANIVLPLHELQLNGQVENNHHKFNWNIVADESVTQQSLEVSTDGTTFNNLVSLQADARDFSYIPKGGGALYYRLNVAFDNGRQYYSNVIMLQSNQPNAKPALITNIINSNISVNSPSAYSYAVYDFNGRTIMKGNLSQGLNNIQTPYMTKGMYIIQYFNGSEQYTEKFMKQ